MEIANGRSTSLTLADAWADANQSNGESAAWSEEMDSYANSDYFSAGTQSTRAGQLGFYDQETGAPSGGVIAVAGPTFPLTPVALVNESLNVAGAVSSANSQLSLGGYTTVAANGLTTYTSVGGLKANYYQGASGGVTYTGMSLQNSMAISTATAQSAAVSFVQSSFGMPSDAVLVDTLSKFTRESNGSRILTGYEFVWNHAGGSILGGDAIKVDVEDDHYISASYCDKWMKHIV